VAEPKGPRVRGRPSCYRRLCPDPALSLLGVLVRETRYPPPAMEQEPPRPLVQAGPGHCNCYHERSEIPFRKALSARGVKVPNLNWPGVGLSFKGVLSGRGRNLPPPPPQFLPFTSLPTG
jgi:hypothetical protein